MPIPGADDLENTFRGDSSTAPPPPSIPAPETPLDAMSPGRRAFTVQQQVARRGTGNLSAQRDSQESREFEKKKSKFLGY